MNNKSIILITYGDFETDFLLDITEDIKQEFEHPAIVHNSLLDMQLYYDANRRQYNGNSLLMKIDALTPGYAVKKIGLFTVDLFIPILTYIFGQAIYQGNTGIVSIYRLRNEQYGMQADVEILYDRLRKVIIHELGHTFGLVHCHVPNCVMRSSTYVEDIDQKEFHLCNKCREIYTQMNP